MTRGHDEPPDDRTLAVYSAPGNGDDQTKRQTTGPAPVTDPASDPGSSVEGLSAAEDLASPSDADLRSRYSTASDAGAGPDLTDPDSGLSWAGGQIVPGQVLFGRYLIESKIDEAGMGQVWLVRHIVLKAQRALKVIRPQVALHDSMRARFIREALVMAELVHEHIVVVHDASFSGDLAFIEMELIRGKSLNKLMKPGEPMPLDWIGRILEQLCDALHVAHEHQVIHRDLKPSNLMLVDGRPPGKEFLKVLDFGIAKILGSDNKDTGGRTLTEGFLGTVQYASPEQLLDQPIGPRSDIYSTGVMLYEMLTGYRPFGGPQMEQMHGHAYLPSPPMAAKNPQAHVPPQVEQVVMRCLAKDPATRPQSALELAEAFRGALEEAGVSYSRPSVSGLAPAIADLSPTEPIGAPRPEDRTPPTWPRGAPRPAAWAGGAAPERKPDPRTGDLTEWPEPLHQQRRPVWLPVAAVMAVLAGGITLAFLLKPNPVPGQQGTNPREKEEVSLPVPKGLTPGALAALPLWRTAGYEPEDLKDLDGGWPRVLVRTVDGTQLRFVHTPAHRYLPEGYDPEGTAAAADGWPAALVRRRDGARFLRIPGGPFDMGLVKDAQGRPVDVSAPARPVILTGFYMQEFEVTNGEVEAFYNALGLPPAKQPEDWRRAFEDLEHVIQQAAQKHPAVMLSHRDAATFALWAQGRLPTEAQWEYAARSCGKDHVHVAGIDVNKAIKPQANINSEGDYPFFSTLPGGSFPGDRTEQNVVDLTGNVREWCRDIWGPFAPEKARLHDPDPHPSVADPTFVIRGGSFHWFENLGKTTQRQDHEAEDHKSSDLGFRLVLECPAAPMPPTAPAATAAR